MQNYTEIGGQAVVKDSRTLINQNFETIQSNNSGSGFPTNNLFAGMKCYRTDTEHTYTLTDTDKQIWKDDSIAEKLASAVNISIHDAPDSNTGTIARFDGSSNLIINLPGTISASLSGTPTAPTPTLETNNNQIATTKYSQPRDQTLTALSSIQMAADKMIYATGSDAFSITDLTEYARTLLDDADAAAARKTLGALGNDHNADTTAHAAAFAAHNADTTAHAAAFAAHTNEFGVATLKRSYVYATGDIAYSNHLPTWTRLECVTAGKTAPSEPDLSTYTTAGAYISDRNVKWILSDVRDAAPVGEIQLFYSLHSGYVKANGATVNRADYPRLVAFAETNNLWVDYTLKFSGTTTANSATVTGISSDDMAKLQREMKVTGTGIPVGTTISKLNRAALTITLSAVATTAGKIDITYGYNENFPERFGMGDGSTTFTLPNAIGRVLEAGTSVGNTAAGLPNITGDISTSANMQTAGAFCGGSGPAYGEYHGDWGHTVFDASRSNSIYGNSATVQPKTLGLLPQLRY